MPFHWRVAAREVAYLSLVTSIIYAVWFILTVLAFYGVDVPFPVYGEPKIFGFIGTFGLAYSWFIFIYAAVTSCDIVLRVCVDVLMLKATKREADPKKALKHIFKWKIVFFIKVILFLIWPLRLYDRFRITDQELLVPIAVILGMLHIVNKHVDELEGDTTPTYMSNEMMSPLLNVKI